MYIVLIYTMYIKINVNNNNNNNNNTTSKYN